MCGHCTALKPAALRLDYDNIFRSILADRFSKPRLKSGSGLSPDSIDDDDNDDEIDEEQAADKRREQKKAAKKQTLRQKLTAAEPT